MKIHQEKHTLSALCGSIPNADEIDKNMQYLLDEVEVYDQHLKTMNKEHLIRLSKNHLDIISNTICYLNNANPLIYKTNNGLSDEYIGLILVYLRCLYVLYFKRTIILIELKDQLKNPEDVKEVSQILARHCVSIPKPVKRVDITSNFLFNSFSQLKFTLRENVGIKDYPIFTNAEKSGVYRELKPLIDSSKNLTVDLILTNHKNNGSSPITIVVKRNDKNNSYELYGLDISEQLVSDFYYYDLRITFNPNKFCFVVPDELLTDVNAHGFKCTTDVLVKLFGFIVESIDYVYLYDADILLKNKPRSLKSNFDELSKTGDIQAFESAINPS